MGRCETGRFAPKRREKTITSNRQKCAEGAGGDEKREKDVRKKTIYGTLLVAILALNLFLTLQSPEGTVGLSEGLRHWLERFGYFTDFHTFRSNAHLVMFFVFGVILSLFGRACGWNWWVILAVGCCVGLIDEGIKVLLPTREFDVVDLVKDWVGVAAAMLVIWLTKGIKQKG